MYLEARTTKNEMKLTKGRRYIREINEIQNTITDIKQVFQELKSAGYDLKNEANEKTIDIKTGKSQKAISRYNTRQAATQEAAKKKLENMVLKTVGAVEGGRPVPQILLRPTPVNENEFVEMKVPCTPSPNQRTQSSREKGMEGSTPGM